MCQALIQYSTAIRGIFRSISIPISVHMIICIGPGSNQLCLGADKHLSHLISRINIFLKRHTKATAAFQTTTKRATKFYSNNLITCFTHNSSNFSVLSSILVSSSFSTRGWGNLASTHAPLLNLEIPIFLNSQWRSHCPSLILFLTSV